MLTFSIYRLDVERDFWLKLCLIRHRNPFKLAELQAGQPYFL